VGKQGLGFRNVAAFAKGNKAASHDKPWTRALEKVAARNPDQLLKLAEKTFSLALEGDANARKEIGDRLDGKPIQPIDAKVTGEFVVNLHGDDAKL
jgi:hypothetical protein